MLKFVFYSMDIFFSIVVNIIIDIICIVRVFVEVKLFEIILDVLNG